MTYSFEPQKRVIALRTGTSFPVVSEEDKAANGAIYPGHLVAYDNSGNLVKNPTGGAVVRKFALERDEMGKTIDDPYAANDQVKTANFRPGDHVLAFIASGVNVAKGDELEADGAGGVRAASSGATIAIAAEDLDNSAGDATEWPAGKTAPVAGTARIRIEIV